MPQSSSSDKLRVMDLIQELPEGDPRLPKILTILNQRGATRKRAIATSAIQETNETPAEILTAVIEKMNATAEKHRNFGFGSPETLVAFLETLPQKISPDSLATIRALKPRETAESYTVFFKDGNEIFLGESTPSSKGADGKEGNGVKIAATEDGKALGLHYKRKYSKTGSAEALFVQLEQAGAKDLIRPSRSMMESLKALGFFSLDVPNEWFSDPAALFSAWHGSVEAGSSNMYGDALPYKDRGVRALRNVTREFEA